MVNKQTIFKLQVVLALALFCQLPALAQFKQFRSKTKLANNSSHSKAEVEVESEAEDSVTNDDPFGHDSGLGDIKLPKAKKDNRLVNLNPETAFGPEMIEKFEYTDVSLMDLTKDMQKLTGLNLILDTDLKGKVSIMAPAPITVGDAWKAYLTALNMKNYSIVKTGAFYKIISDRDVRYTTTKMYTGPYVPNTDNYVMRVIPLKNVDATQVTRAFRPFMSRQGRVLEIKQTNTIIIQDTGHNINRLMRLIRFVDVPGYEETLQIIKVKHSSAQEIATLLDKILQSGNSSRSRRTRSKRSSSESEDISKIIAEPRTNSIIAMANADGAKRLRELIQKLDTKQASSTSGQIHVYYLNHGDAKTLAETLNKLVTGQVKKKTTSRFAKRSADEDETALFNNQVKITADEKNNALVITAAPTDYLTIKSVIHKLDVPRDQVYVEAIIMETTVRNTNSFGVSLLGAYGSGAKFWGVGDSQGDIIGLLTQSSLSLGQFFVGLGAGKTRTLKLGNTDVSVNSVNGLIKAIASNSNTNVLATPQIMAIDNEEATFSVGDEIPIPKTTIANNQTQVSTDTQDVKLTLKITPQINKASRYIKMKIDQDIRDFSNVELPQSLQNSGVAIKTRKTVTTVNVRDKDTIAMGGLMRDRINETVAKVPLLGDIPILGWLFKNKKKDVEKVNMIFFLTPTILSNYQKNMSENVKDVLLRRAGHLEQVHGENDPFGTTIKGIYEKVQKQSEGPLYDKDDVQDYQDESIDPTSVEVENKKEIVQDVPEKKAAPKRSK
ncbi:MAG: type II secretion system secretin GspD [Halobacteriovoraceae bacterium]|nr:type II secretion system secretin GspD [Halobacteriovoraceae bacterium]